MNEEVVSNGMVSKRDTTIENSRHVVRCFLMQESRLTQLYGEALSQLQSGQLERAQSLFQAILQDPISIKAQVSVLPS